MKRVIFIGLTVLNSIHCFAEELTVGEETYGIEAGKVVIPLRKVLELRDRAKAQNPDQEFKSPAMFFRASTRVGDFGIIKDESEAIAGEPKVKYTLKTNLVVAQRLGSRNALVRSEITITGEPLTGYAAGQSRSSKFDALFYFDGFDFSDVADNAALDFQGQGVIASGIYEYVNALGARSSVLRIVPANIPAAPPEKEKPKEFPIPSSMHDALISASPREWSGISKDGLTRGTAYNYTDGELWIFTQNDGVTHKIKISALSKSDRDWLSGKLKDFRIKKYKKKAL